MADKRDELPPALKRQIKNSLLNQLKDDQGLDIYELSLFEWYLRENAKVIERMLLTERAYIQEQMDAGAEDFNDSGMVAVEYYIKRARYADLIYMTSLLEMYLDRACQKLMFTVGDRNVLFRPDELAGDRWTKRKKFIERYGKFEFPERVWTDLRTLITIRNNLVHDNGDTSTLGSNDKKRIQKYHGVSLDKHEIVIDDKYVNYCLSRFSSLIQLINNQLDKYVDIKVQTNSAD